MVMVAQGLTALWKMQQENAYFCFWLDESSWETEEASPLNMSFLLRFLSNILTKQHILIQALKQTHKDESKQVLDSRNDFFFNWNKFTTKSINLDCLVKAQNVRGNPLPAINND